MVQCWGWSSLGAFSHWSRVRFGSEKCEVSPSWANSVNRAQLRICSALCAEPLWASRRSLGWVPGCVTWASAVHENQNILKSLRISRSWNALGQVATWESHLVKWLCITYTGTKGHWFKCLLLPLIQVISLTGQGHCLPIRYLWYIHE